VLVEFAISKHGKLRRWPIYVVVSASNQPLQVLEHPLRGA
jgi:hypothetical protein